MAATAAGGSTMLCSTVSTDAVRSDRGTLLDGGAGMRVILEAVQAVEEQQRAQHREVTILFDRIGRALGSEQPPSAERADDNEAALELPWLPLSPWAQPALSADLREAKLQQLLEPRELSRASDATNEKFWSLSPSPPPPPPDTSGTLQAGGEPVRQSRWSKTAGSDRTAAARAAAASGLEALQITAVEPATAEDEKYSSETSRPNAETAVDVEAEPGMHSRTATHLVQEEPSDALAIFSSVLAEAILHDPRNPAPSSMLFSSGTRIPPLKDGLRPWLSARATSWIYWKYFDYLIGIVILLNSITVGWEAAEEAKGIVPAWTSPVETAFLCIYLVELCLRFLSDGRANFGKSWVLFDIFLVGLGSFSMILTPLISMASQSESDSDGGLTVLESIMILRIFRLLRLLRALRLLVQFKTLWRLVQGLMTSAGTMLSTLALLFFVIYVFACIGLEVITKQDRLRYSDDDELRAVIENNFSTLPLLMMTLIQFVTLDSVAGIYGPLVKDQWYLVFYFLAVLIIIPVALMNLVTAVLVEAALELGQNDEEMLKEHRRQQLEALRPQIADAFKEIDADKSGIINQSEIFQASGHLPDVLTERLKPDQVLDFFETLDVDGSGCVNEEEFVDGVVAILLSEVPIETQQTMKLLRLIRTKVLEISDGMERVEGRFDGNRSPKSRREQKREHSSATLSFEA